MELRKLRGPVLDTFYARLRRCGDLACAGRPFTEHRNVPVLTVDPGDSRPAYRQIADTLAEMIRSGQLRVGERLPSVREMSEGGVPTASARHALEVGSVHVAHNYLVRSGQRIRKDTKTHQDRRLAIDRVTCDVLAAHRQRAVEALAAVGLGLADRADVFSNDPASATAWNPDWTSHQVAMIASRAGVSMNVKSLRHYTATQLLSGGIDLRNTAARLGHGDGGATTLKHYADPSPRSTAVPPRTFPT
ncbi:MAG TPA: GntR family transcriptional regulator [Streptosporangiaceae bacterium]